MLFNLTSNAAPFIITIVTEDNKIIELKTSHFPDREIYLRIMNPEAVSGASITVTSSLDSSEDLVKAIILLDDLRRNGAKNIRLILNKEYDVKNNMDRLLRFYCDQLFFKKAASDVTPLRAIKKDEGPHLVTKVLYEHRRLEQDAKEAADYINIVSEKIEIIKPTESPLSWKVDIKSGLRGEDVILVHTTENVYDFAELWVMLIALRMAGVNSISLINTYEGYSRQDKEFNPGEAVSAETMLKTLDALVDNHMGLNIHYADNSGKVENKSDPGAFVNKYTLYNLNAFVQLAENLFDRIAVWSEGNLAEELNKHPLVLVGPDDGALGYAEEGAEVLKNYIQKKYNIDITVHVGYMDKKRISGKEVQVEGRVLGKDGNAIATVPHIKDCWVMILDDETSWGTTLLASTYALVRKAGVAWSRVLTGVVHGKLARGLEPFRTGYDEEDIIAAVKNGVAIEPKQEYINETKKLMPPRLFVTTRSMVLPKDFPEDQSVSIGPIIAHAAKTFVGKKAPLYQLKSRQKTLVRTLLARKVRANYMLNGRFLDPAYDKPLIIALHRLGLLRPKVDMHVMNFTRTYEFTLNGGSIDIIGFNGDYAENNTEAFLQDIEGLKPWQVAVVITRDRAQAYNLNNLDGLRQKLGKRIFIVRLKEQGNASEQWSRLSGNSDSYDFSGIKTVEDIINIKELIQRLAHGV